MENSAALEELCMKDDNYFNLLYKPYDSSKFGISQRNMERPNADPNSNSRINRNDNEWLSSVLDYRRMDEELARGKNLNNNHKHSHICSNLLHFQNNGTASFLRIISHEVKIIFKIVMFYII